MKIPKKLKICGLDYTIEIVDNMVEDENLSGQHEANKLIIRLHKGNYHQQKTEQTFWHEITHAISVHYLGTKEMDEDQCDNFGNGLYQVLKDNNLLRT